MMKKVSPLLHIIFLLFCIHSFAQKITIDYWVDYEIETKTKKDTITIGYNKNGNYLYSNSRTLAEMFQKKVLKGQTNPANSSMHIVYDLRNQFAYFLIDFDKNEFFMKIDVNNFIPKKREESPFKEGSKFILEKTEKKIRVEDTDYQMNHVYIDSEPENKFEIALSKKMKFDNTAFFKEIFSTIYGLENSYNKIKIPKMNGVILYAGFKNKTFLKAIKTETKAKTLDINYSYKITE